jgi:hypothetical protein
MNILNKNNPLNNEEKAILIGGLLGDEVLVRRDGSYRYRVAHSIHQADYVYWKHNKLININRCKKTPPPKIYLEKGKFERIEFNTDSGNYFQEIHELMYKKLPNGRYRKTITQEVIDKLPVDPLVVAVWYLDDGSIRNDGYAGKIASQGFSKEENSLLCDYLRKFNLRKFNLRKFNINCHIVKHTEISGQWYITIPASTFGNLIKVIDPIVREVPSMVYK